MAVWLRLQWSILALCRFISQICEFCQSPWLGFCWGGVAASAWSQLGYHVTGTVARAWYWHNKFHTPPLYWKCYFWAEWVHLEVSYLLFYCWFIYLLRILDFSRLVNVDANICHLTLTLSSSMQTRTGKSEKYNYYNPNILNRMI